MSLHGKGQRGVTSGSLQIGLASSIQFRRANRQHRFVVRGARMETYLPEICHILDNPPITG